MKKVLSVLFLLGSLFPVWGQDEYADRQFQFLSYEKVPTWTGLVSGWNTHDPLIHLFDADLYPGHADFASKGLKTGTSFQQFKIDVKSFATRKYLPFFLYDAREYPIVLDGKKYTWAVMLEDYSYTDNPEQMALTMLKLMQLIKAFIARSAKAPAENNGIVVLSTNLQARPNTSAAPLLNQNGFPNRTIHELTTLFQASSTSVLNSGTAYGYLKYVAKGQQDTIRLYPHDIVIYENMPARVPPVSGIITLEPQTPLSHINLLAKNRKTINLYTAHLDDIPGLRAHLGKLVKFSCTGKKIMVSDARLSEAKKFWLQRSTRVSIPLPDLSTFDLVDLSSTKPDLVDVSLVGAKASNYALIQKAFPQYVRPGYAIPIYWYFNTLNRCGADSLVKAFVKKKGVLSTNERKIYLDRIRKKIMEAQLDTGLLHQVKKLADTKFPGSRIRLRSSTNCEDLPEFNGAGLYVSKGYNVKDSLKKLERKILEVYASLWSVAAFEEREFYFMDHTKAGMAILINEAYSKEVANGVALIIPQKKGYSLFINTQVGDALVTNPLNGQIPEAILFAASSDTAYVVESHSNIKDIFLSHQFDEQLKELKKLTMDVQKLFDARNKTGNPPYGVDIEFRIMEEKQGFKLYIKQARLLRQVLPE